MTSNFTVGNTMRNPECVKNYILDGNWIFDHTIGQVGRELGLGIVVLATNRRSICIVLY